MASVERRLRVLTSGICRPAPAAAPSTWEELLAKDPDGVPLAPHPGWRDAFLYVNGVRLHYWRTPGGNRPDGTPKPVIVLSHGMGDNGLSWWYFLGELTEQFELVSIEARGHGLSDPPTDETAPDAQAEDIAAVIKELGLVKPIVMGHSMGSASTMWFAARYPDVSLSLSLSLSLSFCLSLSISHPLSVSGASSCRAGRPAAAHEQRRSPAHTAADHREPRARRAVRVRDDFQEEQHVLPRAA